MNSSTSQVTWLHRLVSYLGTAYFYFMGKTSFFHKEVHPAFLALALEKKPFIYAFWHNAQLILVYAHRGQQVATMVSRSKDGEYIAQVIKNMGLMAVRGSSSRGGDQAFREILTHLESGGRVGFTPDGPRGPVQSINPGVVKAAQISGCPIVPLGAYSFRKIVFNSWDKFILPLPFGVNVIAHGRPFYLDKELDLETAQKKVRDTMNEATLLAKEMGENRSWASAAVGSFGFFLYAFFGFLLSPLWILAAVFHFGLKRSLQDFKERVGYAVLPQTTQKRLWIHAASVGEWQAIKPFIPLFKKNVTVSLYVTVSTPEAKKIILKEEPTMAVSLLPLDLKGVMESWIKKLNPQAVLLVETELWPHLVHELCQKNVPLFVVNGRLSSRSVKRWSWIKPFIKLVMSEIPYFFVRSELDRDHFVQLGADPFKVMVTGNTKADNLTAVSWEDKMTKKKNFFGSVECPIVVAGSTWPGEEEFILSLLDQKISQKFKIIVAPRRPERFAEIKTLLESQRRSYSLWSQVKETKSWPSEVLLVDTLGDLKNLYGAADVAFVGGSLVQRGGQNPFEPASARLPLVWGPSMENFHIEALALLENGAAFQSAEKKELLDKMGELLSDESLRRTVAESAVKTVESRQGATARTFEKINELLRI